MTYEKLLEKVEAIYTIDGDFSHACHYIKGLYGLSNEFMSQNFDRLNNDMLAKYPGLYFGGVI